MKIMGITISAFLSLIFFLVTFESVQSSNSPGIRDLPIIQCPDNSTCLKDIEGSFCDIPSGQTEGTCKCESGIVNDSGNKCLDGDILIGNPCEKHEQCVGYDDASSECLIGSLEKVCACRDGYVHSKENNECLQIINNLEGDICKENIQCHRGVPGNLSSCQPISPGSVDGICRCNGDAINGPESSINQHRCFKKAQKIGDGCELDTQCTPNLNHSRCENSICICNENYVNATDLSACLSTKYLREDCTDPVQCIVPDSICKFENSNDQTGKCTCRSGYISPDSESRKCYKNALIGQNCEIPIQCPQNSYCNTTTSTCTCNDNHVPRANRTECLPIATTLGDDCKERVQCQLLPNADCIRPYDSPSTKCSCIPERFVQSQVQDNACVEIVHERNLPCSESIQCSAGLGYALCEDDVCQCKAFYGYYNGMCYIPAKLGEACQVVEQCKVGLQFSINNLTVCNASPTDPQKRCRCLPGTEEYEGKCYNMLKRIGESCETNDECTISIIGQVECYPSSKTCRCKIGYTATAANTMCSSSGVNIAHFKSFIEPILILLSILSFSVKAIIL